MSSVTVKNMYDKDCKYLSLIDDSIQNLPVLIFFIETQKILHEKYHGAKD